ncbi:MAG: hypothetical protein OXC48_08740, partial [Endozoicomonadaceae bacterium]|nr:hypothetical protein [Endozoicomonadaceae bacterium]
MIKIISFRKRIFLFMLFLFCLVFTQASRASEASIIAFFITDTGMHVTVGVDDKTIPEKTFFMDQSTEPTLTQNSPLFIFTDSSLKFFLTFWRKYEKEIQALLDNSTHKKLPLKVYIAATGLAQAKVIRIKEDELINDYISSCPNNLQWLLGGMNVAEFFNNVFYHEIEKSFPGKTITMYETVAGEHLLTNTVSVYYGQIKSASGVGNGKLSDQSAVMNDEEDLSQPAIVAYLSTDIRFYKIDDVNNAENHSFSYFISQGLHRLKLNKNIYDIGLSFREKHLNKLITSETMQAVTESFDQKFARHTASFTDKIQLNQQQFEASFCEYQKKHRDDLLSAVYSADILHDAKHTDHGKTEPTHQGAPCMMYLLGRLGKGYNLFGDCVSDVLSAKGYTGDQFAERLSRIKITCPEYSAERACDQVIDLVDNVFESFLAYIICISQNDYCLWSHAEDGTMISNPFILTGDRANLLKQYASRKNATLPELLLQRLQDQQYVNKLFEKMQTSPNEQLKVQFETDIKTKVIPFVKNILIVPEEEFTNLMYQVALRYVHKSKNINPNISYLHTKRQLLITD